MRRFIRLATALASIAGVVTLASPVAHAAAGDVTTTNVSVPAALQGLTGMGLVSARDGGVYYAYASGNNYKVFKTKSDGSQDTAFGVAGIADVPGFSSSTSRINLTSGLNGQWWAVAVPNAGSGGPKVTLGGATGAPTATLDIPYTDFQAYCASAYPTMTPTTWIANNYRVYPRRGSGFWMSYSCQGVNGSNIAVTPLTMWTLTAYSAAGVRDTAVAHVGTVNALNSSGQCFLTATVADPTAPATEPELYVVRTETNVLLSGQCSGSPVNVAAANVTGYSILEVASNGTTTTRILASAGDASDGQLTGRIDPGGRLVLFNTNLADTSKMTIRRMKSDGTLDTSIGTAGIVTINIGAAPAGQTSVTASATGIITTPTKVYFAVLLSDRTAFTTQCASSAPFTWGWRMAVVSPTDGILSSYGTAGVGGRVSVTAAESIGCTGTVGGGNGVDTTGTPRMIRFDSGATKLDKWEAPVGTNGGGDGGTGSGGATSDTGGAPSKGESSSSTSTASNVDDTVYSKKLPTRITANTAIQVLTATQAKTQTLETRTPKVCLTLTTSIVVTGTGTCTVRVLSKADKTTLRTLTSKSTATATTVGTSITASDPLKFSIVSWKLSAATKAQIAKLAETAKTASRVLVVGHSGMLFENEAANQHISTFRAAAVKAALQKAGVKTPFSVVGMGSRVPLTTTKTESAQAKNRRVVLYFFP